MAITSQLEIAKKPLFPVNIETGAVGSGDGAWLLQVPRSSIHKLRVGQEPAVLALGVGWGCLDNVIVSVLSTSGRRLNKD